jgi:hypothetical protein
MSIPRDDQATPGELTREDIVRVVGQLAVYDRDTVGVRGAVTQILSHDAAMRQKLTDADSLIRALRENWRTRRDNLVEYYNTKLADKERDLAIAYARIDALQGLVEQATEKGAR